LDSSNPQQRKTERASLMAEKQKELVDRTPKAVQSTDFASVYANFTKFENTPWDHKISFGEIIEQNPEGGTVEYHTAVTMSWPSVKVMAFYLALNIAFYEHEHGAIQIPKATLQPDIQHLADKPLQIEQLISEATKIRKIGAKKS
jgi:hypothetical protein